MYYCEIELHSDICADKYTKNKKVARHTRGYFMKIFAAILLLKM